MQNYALFLVCMESRLTEGLRLHCNHRSNTARNEAAYGSKQAENERFMRFRKPAMSVSLLIGSFGDLPFEKSQNLTTHPLGLFHGRMNEQNAWYGAWGECDFNARVKEAADCASRGGNSMPKEADIAPLYVMYVEDLRRGWLCGSVLQTGLPFGQENRGSEVP